MESFEEIIKKEGVYEAVIEQLPEVMQEIALVCEPEDLSPYKWESDPIRTLAHVRQLLQELVEVIGHEKAKIIPK